MPKIQKLLESPSPTITLEGMQISLSFLSPWFGTAVPPLAAPTAVAEDAFPASPEDMLLLSALQTCWSQFNHSGAVTDRFYLTHSIIHSTPVFRNRLGLSRMPGVLWLFGYSAPPSRQLYLYAVSPSLIPGYPWEIVHDSEITLNLSHASATREPHLPVDSPSHSLTDALLNCLLVRSKCPGHVSRWGVSFPEGVSHRDKEVILEQMSWKEKAFFAPDRAESGVVVYFAKELLQRQRHGRLLEEIADNQNEMKANQATMLLQLDRVEGALSQVLQQLSGVFVDIRAELLQMSKGTEGDLAEMREMWRTGMDGLETAIRSSSENAEAAIEEHLTGLELDLDLKLSELGSANSDRLVEELGRVREELLAANRSRLQGDEAASRKLDQILSEMRSLQTQLDRVEATMNQYFGALSESLGTVQTELQSKGNSDGLKELRDIWVSKMGALETICLSNAAANEAAIEKHLNLLDKQLKKEFFDLKVSVKNVSPQLGELKKQLVETVSAMRDGDEESKKRYDSMMAELKGLQTQFVEVIRLQREVSTKLDEVRADC